MTYPVLASGSTPLDTYAPTQLIAGSSNIITLPYTVTLSGSALPVGRVLGQITASGKMVPCDPGATDGSEVAVAILAVPLASATGDVVAPCYVAGEFNVAALTFDSGVTTTAAKLATFGPAAPIKLRSLA
jgi:hypothetical protein